MTASTTCWPAPRRSPPTPSGVTQAHLRKVTLPGGAGSSGLITLDNGEDHTKPNTFGPRGLLSLNAAIDAALADDEVTALGVTGKPFILAAGADLTSIAGGGPDGVRIVAELGHAVFRKLGEGGKPSFGFVNGLALGGGLEVALHCTYRTVCDSAPALGLPEVMLGLVPGWGGAWLVPNLVGAEAAVKLVLENPLNNGKTLKGADGLRVRARRRGLRGRRLPRAVAALGRRGADAARSPWTGPASTGARPGTPPSRRAVRSPRPRPAGPPPPRSVRLDLIAAPRSPRATRASPPRTEALAELGQTPELLASLYAFDLVQKRAKRPAGAPDRSLARPVTKVGIVGAGLMASQLALLFVRRLAVPVVLTDLDQERVDKGVGYVHAEIDKLLPRAG